MERNFSGWLVVVLMVCGSVSTARAAEQGGQPSKQQATPTSAVTHTVPMSASTPRATQPMSATPAAATQTATSSALEGTTWSVKATPDAMAAQKGEKPFDDSLIFKDGKVTMSACVKMGFAPSGYTAIPGSSGSWAFLTQQVSPSQGTTRWMTTFTGEAVKGTMTWTKQDGSVLRYTVEGKKATTPGAS